MQEHVGQALKSQPHLIFARNRHPVATHELYVVEGHIARHAFDRKRVVFGQEVVTVGTAWCRIQHDDHTA